MHHLVYTSIASVSLPEEELQRQLQHWRATNAELGITGVLLYSEGSVLQVLEGAPETIHSLYNAIAVDIRHRSVTKLADGPVQGRAFTEWSMNFRAVDPANFNRFLHHLNIASEHGHGLLSVLEDFMLSEAQA